MEDERCINICISNSEINPHNVVLRLMGVCIARPHCVPFLDAMQESNNLHKTDGMKAMNFKYTYINKTFIGQHMALQLSLFIHICISRYT